MINWCHWGECAIKPPGYEKNQFLSRFKRERKKITFSFCGREMEIRGEPVGHIIGLDVDGAAKDETV